MKTKMMQAKAFPTFIANDEIDTETFCHREFDANIKWEIESSNEEVCMVRIDGYLYDIIYGERYALMNGGLVLMDPKSDEYDFVNKDLERQLADEKWERKRYQRKVAEHESNEITLKHEIEELKRKVKDLEAKNAEAWSIVAQYESVM